MVMIASNNRLNFRIFLLIIIFYFIYKQLSLNKVSCYTSEENVKGFIHRLRFFYTFLMHLYAILN